VFLSLEKSAFPLDQLLDYLPDTGIDWVYNAEEWNSTYLANCKFTPHTSIAVNLTGIHTDSVYWLYDEIPALWTILSPRFRRHDIIQNTFWGGLRNPEIGLWPHVIIWQYADLSSSEVSNAMNGSTQETTVSLAALYMKDAPEYNMTDSDATSRDWAFGTGYVPEAYYTKVECDIRRSRPADNNFWEAYPQIRTQCDVAKQVNSYWQAFVIKPEDGTGEKTLVSLPSGEDLFRFYQAFMIAKDTWYPWHSTREISVRLKTVELSIAFIVICGLILLVLLLGLLHWLLFRLRHSRMLHKVPGTKIDWALQSVQEAQATQSGVAGNESQALQSVTDRRLLWLSVVYALQRGEPHAQLFLGKVKAGNKKAVRQDVQLTTPDRNAAEEDKGLKIFISPVTPPLMPAAEDPADQRAA